MSEARSSAGAEQPGAAACSTKQAAHRSSVKCSPRALKSVPASTASLTAGGTQDGDRLVAAGGIAQPSKHAAGPAQDRACRHACRHACVLPPVRLHRCATDASSQEPPRKGRHPLVSVHSASYTRRVAVPAAHPAVRPALPAVLSCQQF